MVSPLCGAAKVLKFRRKNALENLLTPKSSNVTVGFDGFGRKKGLGCHDVFCENVVCAEVEGPVFYRLANSVVVRLRGFLENLVKCEVLFREARP